VRFDVRQTTARYPACDGQLVADAAPASAVARSGYGGASYLAGVG
jgi:hypothetical protein